MEKPKKPCPENGKYKKKGFKEKLLGLAKPCRKKEKELNGPKKGAFDPKNRIGKIGKTLANQMLALEQTQGCEKLKRRP